MKYVFHILIYRSILIVIEYFEYLFLKKICQFFFLTYNQHDWASNAPKLTVVFILDIDIMSTFLCDINLGIAHTTYFDRFISITLNGIQSQIIMNLKRRFCVNWFPLKSLIDDHSLFPNIFCSHIEFMVCCFCSILYSPHFYYISFFMLKILNNRFHHKI